MSYLPSKKFQYAFFSALILIAGVFLLKEGLGTSRAGSGDLELKTTLAGNLLKGDSPDSDGDGLKDWEEVLWKTDPKNRDSDGDGTPDGEEIALGRDPAKKGPDDKITKPATAVSAGEFTGENTNATDELSKSFFAEYLSLKEGGSLNQNTKDQLVDSFIQNLPNNRRNDVYKSADIIVSEDNSTDAIRTYAERLRFTIKKHSDPSQKTDTEVIALVMKDESGESLPLLKENLKIYTDTVTDLKAVKVPSLFSKDHLALINATADIGSILNEVADMFSSDPIISLAAVKRYPEAGEYIISVVRTIQDKFNSYGVDVNLDSL